MEEITMIAAITYSQNRMGAKLERLWIGNDEVSIEGRSISQWLEEMYQQGWILIKSRATADLHGVLCEYDFQRPRAADEQSSTEAQTTCDTTKLDAK